MFREKNYNNDINNYLEKDFLSRNILLNNLIYFLNSIKDNTIIAIDGDWGSGKTVFVKELIHLRSSDSGRCYSGIEKTTLNRFEKKYDDIIYYNAWENDIFDPLESILLALSSHFSSNDPEKSKRIHELLKGILTIYLKFATNGSFDMRDFEKVKEDVLNKYIDHSKKVMDIRYEINSILDEAYVDKNERLLLIVDDLDRCKPSFAVSLLEILKNVFDNKNITIVICSNNDQLQYTIKKYYGEGFNGYSYLDRFYDVIFRLPDPDVDLFIEDCLNFKKNGNNYIAVAIEIVKYKKQSLRQIRRFFSSLKLLEDFFDGQSLKNEGHFGSEVKNIFIPIALFLKMSDIQQFNDFVNGKGESVLRDFSDNCQSIRAIVSESDSKNITIVDYYHQLFSGNVFQQNSFEAFVKATSLLGFSIIADEEGC